MEMDINHFNKEIKALQESQKNSGSLHPLRKAELKQALLSQIQNEHPSVAFAIIQRERRMSMIRYIASTVLGISLIGGTALASNGAKPGDMLFPVKKIKEDIQVSLTTDNTVKAQLQEQIAEDRLNSLLQISGDDQTQNPQTPAPTPDNNTDANQQNQNSNGNDQNEDQTEHQNTSTTNPNSNSGKSTNNSNSGNRGRGKSAEAQAENEFSQAIKNLQATQSKLQASGQTDAAAQVGNTIAQLQQRFQIQTSGTTNANVNEQRDQNDDHGNDQNEQENHGGNNGSTQNQNSGHDNHGGNTSNTTNGTSSNSNSGNIKIQPPHIISHEPLIPLNPSVNVNDNVNLNTSPTTGGQSETTTSNKTSGSDGGSHDGGGSDDTHH